MPVNSLHADLETATTRWRQVRDCIEGSQAVKNAGSLYLPVLGSQEDHPQEYLKYKKRALYFNATNRTHDAILGFLFRKPPIVQLGPKGKDGKETATKLIPEAQLANIDTAGNSILEYARLVGDDVASVGRCGTMIDWVDDEGVARARFTFYAAENIINWRASYVGGKFLITLLVLEERVETEAGDEFCRPETSQWRVLRLTDQGVSVTVYRETKTKPQTDAMPTQGGGELSGLESYDVVEQRTMVRRGVPLMEIPFIFHNADHVGPAVGISPLYDLTEVNISHYQTSADLENGRHIAGVPTPYAFGLTGPTGEPVPASVLYLGGPAWVSTNTDAQCGFLEFTAAGLGSLEKAHDEKLAMMAAIGARMIEPKPGDAEAFETVELRATAETSALASMAGFLSRSMTDCLKWFVWWSGTMDNVDEVKDVSFEINRDFMATRLQPAEVQTLLALVEAGKMSYESFFWNLQRGDMLPPGRKMDEEMDAIETTLTDMPKPTPPPLPLDPNQPPPADDDDDQPAAGPPAAKKAAKKAAGKRPPSE